MSNPGSAIREETFILPIQATELLGGNYLIPGRSQSVPAIDYRGFPFLRIPSQQVSIRAIKNLSVEVVTKEGRRADVPIYFRGLLDPAFVFYPAGTPVNLTFTPPVNLYSASFIWLGNRDRTAAQIIAGELEYRLIYTLESSFATSTPASFPRTRTINKRYVVPFVDTSDFFDPSTGMLTPFTFQQGPFQEVCLVKNVQAICPPERTGESIQELNFLYRDSRGNNSGQTAGIFYSQNPTQAVLRPEDDFTFEVDVFGFNPGATLILNFTLECFQYEGSSVPAPQGTNINIPFNDTSLPFVGNFELSGAVEKQAFGSDNFFPSSHLQHGSGLRGFIRSVTRFFSNLLYLVSPIGVDRIFNKKEFNEGYSVVASTNPPFPINKSKGITSPGKYLDPLWQPSKRSLIGLQPIVEVHSQTFSATEGVLAISLDHNEPLLLTFSDSLRASTVRITTVFHYIDGEIVGALLSTPTSNIPPPSFLIIYPPNYPSFLKTGVSFDATPVTAVSRGRVFGLTLLREALPGQTSELRFFVTAGLTGDQTLVGEIRTQRFYGKVQSILSNVPIFDTRQVIPTDFSQEGYQDYLNRQHAPVGSFLRLFDASERRDGRRLLLENGGFFLQEGTATPRRLLY